MKSTLHISKKSIDKCIEKIIKNEKIDGIVIGPTVYSMNCFAPIYDHVNKNNLPIIVPKFPLIYSNIEKLKFPASGQRFLVFGGGSLIDFVKVCAQRDKIYLTVLLSSISNDGFSSNFSSLKADETSFNQSYPSKAPQSVYACLPLLTKHMPHKFWVSALGELLSKLNVWEDLKVDKKVKEFDQTPFYQIERFINKYTKRNENSLIEIIKQLYSFSLLMKNDSSWCSRSEHEFEKLYAADSKMSHGQLVLMGALVAMKIRCIYKLPDLYEQLLCYCQKLEISLELKQGFEAIIESKTYKRLKKLSSVRPERFGLWNIVDSTTVDWKIIIKEIIKEL
ncbi:MULTISPECIES: iron-containing alcohol dehydrogenase [unclassified Moorena]|uniref:iron-containing alcohol dehydrogenase n=1 Tax=unclassified Moorena TaxID=2683338 RepID=UPI0013C2261C|nr:MULTISPECIES: iron-containing alcohol dehydrogenase [unclassified Moorena]NEP36515.1 iron-containing alcohol dehydrogenase family protein [Moorena sp. SIO3B2]NET64506.1 iron-containing alcohol dehydrogenase family protein [Moorena sp. SIO1G6]